MATGGLLLAGSASDGRRLFTLALLLSTWIPMAFFLGVGSLGEPTGGLETVKIFLLFLGGVHVPVTLLLYTDRKFLPLVRGNKPRYVYVPLALIVASGFIFTVGGATLQLLAYLVLWAWQTHHYGRQNVGVYSFAAIAGGWRPHPLERRVLDLAAVCGVCGTFKILARDVTPKALEGVFDLLYGLGAVAFLGVVIFSVYVYLRNRHDFSLSRTVCYFTLVLFFLPMFLSTDINVAFFSYAIAHGTQYLAFMAVLSLDLGVREGRRAVSKHMVMIAISLVLLGLAGSRAADLRTLTLIESSSIFSGVLDFLAGIGLGTTVAHFVIDAGAWKLSRPSAKRYVTERFGFLFERTPSRVHDVVPQVLSR
jgi:hypothetical protein